MKITTFPANEGDCFVVGWKHQSDTKRILIDGGRKACWAHLKRYASGLATKEHAFELLVISHIDADHIEGVIKMFDDPERQLHFKDAWFNAYEHLTPIDAEDVEDFGPGQGEALTRALGVRGQGWNRAFSGRAAVMPDTGPLDIDVEGLRLTLLSPTQDKLDRLRDQWSKWLAEAGLTATSVPPQADTEADDEVEDFGNRPLPTGPPDVKALLKIAERSDTKPPNGSSIAFIADDGKTRVLFAADAHPDALETSLLMLTAKERRFDLFKLSHHGSANNVSRRLLELIDCRNFLISTNGTMHQHPNPEAIARVLKYAAGAKTLYFNYDQPWTRIWKDADLMREHNYRCVFCDDDKPGFLEIDFS